MKHPSDNSLSCQAVAHNFFQQFYGDTPPDAILTIWLLPSKHTQRFRAHNLEAAAAYAVKQACDCDVYFGVGLRGERLARGRGESADVIALPGFYADIDIKHPVHKATNLPETIDQARLILDKIPLLASLIVLSGHGLQAWWLFRELWIFATAEERQAAAQLNQRLQATLRAGAQLHGWHVDGTADLARVLRLPGTYNRKDPSNPVPVTILEAHSERRYNPSDFEPYLIEIRDGTHSATSEPIPDDVPLIHVATLELHRWLKYLIRTGEHPDDPQRYSDRSTPEWAAVRGMVEAGCDDVTIAGVMLNPKHAISEKPLEKGRRWLEQEIARARAKASGSYTAVSVDDSGQSSSRNGTEHGKAEADASSQYQCSEVSDDQASAKSTTTLADVEEVFRKWLGLPDIGLVHTQLGTIAGNLIPDADPVWLMEISGSGWGKTENLQSASGLPFVHVAATLTEAALLSGTPRKEKATDAKGGLLREIGTFGVLILKDFTSILSMHRDARAAVLAALREIYDGSWTRHVGVDGGRKLGWSGKIGIIAGVTSTIDRHHTVISTMGERFIFYRLKQPDEEQQALQGLRNVGKEKTMRAELSAVVKDLFSSIVVSTSAATLSPAEEKQLISWARLAARCRSPIERDNYTREIELIPDPEAPVRLAQILLRLLTGMLAIGVSRIDAWKHIKKITFDCMPAIRCRVLQFLIYSKTPDRPTSDIATALDYPTETAKRALEDLTAHGILNRTSQGRGKADLWRLSTLASTLLNTHATE